MKQLFFLLFLPWMTNAQYNFYYGNIHSHTEYSDGNKDSLSSGVSTPAGSYAYAKGSYHTDFWGISEHNHYNANNNPGMLLSRYADGLSQADNANDNGTFVCLYGMEFGTISQGGHVVTYGSPGLIGWEDIAGSANYDIYCGLNDFTTYWNILNTAPNCFSTLAHPNSGDYNNLLNGAPYSAAADSNIVGTAIRSGSAFSTTVDYSDPPASLYETEYKKCLARGYHVGPTIDHDNHYTTFGRTVQGRTVVLASVLYRDSIIAAYKQRRFYASDDWNTKVHYTLNGQHMGSINTTKTNSSISIAVEDVDMTDHVNNIEIYYGIPGSGIYPSILISNSNSDTINYTHNTIAGETYYYYAKITQQDGDIIWTSPIWINRIATPVSVEEVFTSNNTSNNTNYTLYPNPVQDKLNVMYKSAKQSKALVRIYNAAGREVHFENITLYEGDNSFSYDVSCFASGQYYYVLQIDHERLIDARFIKY
jgi:hypothetical protein